MKHKYIIAAAMAWCIGSAHAQVVAQGQDQEHPGIQQADRRVEAEKDARQGVALPSTITLYGIVDTGVEYVTNVGAGGKSLARMPTNTAGLPSRWGVRGQENLGDGLLAIFVLESGFAPNNGTLGQGGRLFGRQAFVGLSGGWGTLTLGRQYTMLAWGLVDADLLGPAVFASASLDSYLANARADNSIAYRGTFSGVTVGAMYSFGRDGANGGPSPAGTNCAGQTAGDSRACREWSALLKYDASSFGVALAADQIRGGPGAFGGLTSSSLSDTRLSANGYFNVGRLKVGGGLLHRNNEGSAATPKSDLWYLGAAYTLTPSWIVDGEAFRITFKNSDNKATMGVVRATYVLSKRTTVYAMGGRIYNGGSLALSISGGGPGSTPPPGGAQTGVMMGMRHAF
ncbi:porin [Paraburkholderia phytofirmans]|uniref:porin n=1 Tax=Paraburkholderia phytofirmans TaxID=261302 RepID=UPI0009EDB03A|nr:porin [Paraburkholderia phytofirmans]